MTGQRFVLWTVLDRAGSNKNGDALWNCVCDCGTRRIVQGSRLRDGTTQSCGCRAEENYSEHRFTRRTLHHVLDGMKDRCYSTKNRNYKNYGGRGISICDEWRESFQSFYEWATDNGYQIGLQIDRIDNNGNYEPGNCRWATRTEQARNKRTNTVITFHGATKCLKEWAEITGISWETIRKRLRMGWTVRDTLTISVDATYSANGRRRGTDREDTKYQALIKKMSLIIRKQSAEKAVNEWTNF